MNIGYLREVTDAIDGPPCHVCGAIMVRSMQDVFAEKPKAYWFCMSCGETKEVVGI